MAMSNEDLTVTAQVTDLVHTVISELAEANIYINFRQNDGTTMDRSRERAEVSSRVIFNIICALEFKSTRYWHFVSTMVNYIRGLQHDYTANGTSAEHARQTGVMPTHFTEEAFVYIYGILV